MGKICSQNCSIVSVNRREVDVSNLIRYLYSNTGATINLSEKIGPRHTASEERQPLVRNANSKRL